MLRMWKKKKTYSAYVSKNNSNRLKLVILLIIPKRKKWHYLTEKNYHHC